MPKRVDTVAEVVDRDGRDFHVTVAYQRPGDAGGDLTAVEANGVPVDHDPRPRLATIGGDVTSGRRPQLLSFHASDSTAQPGPWPPEPG